MNGTSERPPTAPGAPPAGGPLSPEGHVTLAGLADYRAHRLPEDVHDRLQEHLVTCAECRELAIEIGDFCDPPEEGEEAVAVAELDVAGGWERVREARRVALAATSRARPSTGQIVKVSLQVAAVLVLGSVGLHAARWYGHGETSLLPVDAFRSGTSGTAIEEVRLPVLLQLRSPVPHPRPAYRADLFDDQGRRVRSFPDLVEGSDLYIRISLPRWSLRPGVYHLELSAAPGGPSALQGTYAFRVR